MGWKPSTCTETGKRVYQAKQGSKNYSGQLLIEDTMKSKRREPLQYSEEFRAAVMAAFPGSERMQRMLEENSFSLGYSLREGGIPAIDPALVVSLLDAGQQDELLRVARDAVQKKKLYELWQNEAYE